jgi:hypothetical protein
MEPDKPRIQVDRLTATTMCSVTIIIITTIIIIIIIIIIFPFITIMEGIYNYIPETNNVSTVQSFAAVLYLQVVLCVMLFRQ